MNKKSNPKAIFLIGSAGAGKSTVGKFLATKLHYCYLDKDIIANRFTGELLISRGYQPTARDECEYYKKQVMDIEYKTLLDIASENLKLNNSVILDAPFLSYFSDKDYISKIIQQFNFSNVDTYVLEVFVPAEILKQRILDRNNPRDIWKLDNWDLFIEGINQKKCLWQNVTYIRFDNSATQIPEFTLLKNFE
ncbi:AAA family ATPase [Gilliamella sp. B2838]|uniref:AAA family ATPase n=1 Tax=Gilliamella sp. B2838 TaxID=2818020 RepID=UPI00226998F9|nr:ATP-binding protein [Gilliamella sp. B2838]MCX8727626.1 ATP-binding protein [Gilliamella sp. B2838]